MGEISKLILLLLLVNNSETTKDKAFILPGIKIQVILDLAARCLVYLLRKILPDEENIAWMNARPYSLKMPSVLVSTLQKT